MHLWGEVQNAVDEISLPGSAAINQYGWIVLFQLFLSLIFSTAISKRKTAFKDSEQWKFLALHPIASGFFLGYMVCVLMYQYQGTPGSWKLVAAIVGGLSFARVMTGIVDASWKNQFIHGLILVFITTRLMDVLSFPLPIFRLYTFFAATVGLCFCLYLAKESARSQKKGFFPLMFQAGALSLLFIIIAEILGKKALPSFLFISLIRSLVTVLNFILFMYIIRGILDWLFKTKALRRSAAMSEDDTEDITRKLAQFIDALIIVLVLVPAILMTWGVYESFDQATAGVFSFGITVGSLRVTIGLLIVSASILYGSFLISWVVPKILVDELFFNRRMEKGARLSLARLVNYIIVVIGFLIALSALGIEVSKITIMLSALGVGIGFGLQGIVNNFVSGLVLLFEQPVRVGDLIETNGMWSEIKHIGIRATRVRNFDHAYLIIPNADLVANQVTNWTLGDRQARLKIAVGVAYGSEVNLVMETLIGCARDNTNVAQSPVPQALFLNFGESSLDFELRVFVKASMRELIRSELHQEIDKRFRENNINIAFPQRELHVPRLEVRLNNNENQ
jgi:small-conductance mechanosensitive channel